jgi:uncharacterized membrane protein
MSLRDRFADDLDEFVLEAPDTYAVLAGVLTLHVGAEMAYAREPSVIWGIASVYVFGSALLLIGAGITDVDLDRWGTPLAVLAASSILSAVGLTYVLIHGSPIGTDALAFVNEAAGTLLAGESPYTGTYTLGDQFPTPMVMGGEVQQYSYPIGSAVVAAPFRAVLEDGARVAVMLSVAALAGTLLYVAPSHLAPLAYASLLVGDFVTWGVADLTDPLWMAPFALALVTWPWSRVGPDRLWTSGVLFGVAMTMKQQPWFCAPFLMLWVARERGWPTAARYVAVVAATFFAIHAPVIAMAPEAAITGLLTNLYGPSGTLVHLGVGLSALTLSGALPMTKGAHTALMGLAGVAGLALFWWRFDDLRWVAWVAWAPLLFFNYRSLANYFVVVAPLAVLIVVARGERTLAERGVTASGA